MALIVFPDQEVRLWSRVGYVMARNPRWHRDNLMAAIYLKSEMLDDRCDDVIKLSDLLNHLSHRDSA